MTENIFHTEVEKALEVLRSGGVILYPTDTIWGIGCDATNASAVKRIYEIKNRSDSKSLIILVAEERDIMKYVAAPHPEVFDYLEEQEKPTTVIYDGALDLPENVISDDGSVAIRIVRDEFCRHLVKRLGKPIVSTSANISGAASPENFRSISDPIKNAVDHIVQWRQDEDAPAQSSRIVKFESDGSVKVIRS